MVELRHAVEETGYWPEYSVLVVRDAGSVPALSAQSADEWYESARGESGGGTSCGSFARAGNGWLMATASSTPGQVVRMEAYDAAPEDDREGWEDVLETPFRSGSGTAALTLLIGGDPIVTMRLGEPGAYRVRVSRNPGDGPDLWRFRLQFWPAPEELPRWLARHRPPPRTHPTWPPSELSDDLFAIVSWAPEETLTTSLTDLAQRLLVPVEDVRQALGYATGRQRLDVTATGPSVDDDPGARLVLTLWSEPDDPWENFDPEAFDIALGGPPGPVAAAFAAEIADFFASSEAGPVQELRRHDPSHLPPECQHGTCAWHLVDGTDIPTERGQRPDPATGDDHSGRANPS